VSSLNEMDLSYGKKISMRQMEWNDAIIDILGLIASLHIETMKNEIGWKTCQLTK